MFHDCLSDRLVIECLRLYRRFKNRGLIGGANNIGGLLIPAQETLKVYNDPKGPNIKRLSRLNSSSLVVFCVALNLQ
jgi:hypothetical protein